MPWKLSLAPNSPDPNDTDRHLNVDPGDLLLIHDGKGALIARLLLARRDGRVVLEPFGDSRKLRSAR